MRIRRLWSLVLGAAALVSGGAATDASASVIRWDMEGEAVFQSNPIPGIALGDAFTASLVYEADGTTPLSFGITPPFGVVSASITYATASGDISFTSNTTSDARFSVLDDRMLGSNIVDEIQITFDSGTVYEPRISFRFIDNDASVFSSATTSFPTDIDLSEWEFAGITLIDSSSTQRDTRGDITSLVVVPEPGTASLVLVGAVASLAFGRGRTAARRARLPVS